MKSSESLFLGQVHIPIWEAVTVCSATSSGCWMTSCSETLDDIVQSIHLLQAGGSDYMLFKGSF